MNKIDWKKNNFLGPGMRKMRKNNYSFSYLLLFAHWIFLLPSIYRLHNHYFAFTIMTKAYNKSKIKMECRVLAFLAA
jgi:hypothetical protein